MPQEKEEKQEYEPFSEQEKKKILERHKELVERFNRTLPDNMKVKFDPDLEKKLDDPKVYGVYRIAQQMEQKKAIQRKIESELESRFGKCKARQNPIGRAFFYELDPSGTPEAEAYNEKLYKDYIEDPYKVVYKSYSKAMNADPTKAYECNDDPLKLAEYYRDTYPLCEEGFVFRSATSTGDVLKEMKNAESIVKPMETIGYPVNMMKAACNLDYFACPKLSLEQSLLIQNTDHDLILEGGEPFKRILDEPLVNQTIESPKSFFGKFVEKGIPLKEGMFVKNRPESYELDASGKKINVKEIKYDDFFNPRAGENVQLSERTGKSLLGVQAMNKSLENRYLKAWQESFNKKRNYAGEFDIHQIEDQHKGGILERYVFFSTSRQYKRFLQAFKDYNDPNSPHYLDKENLKKKGDAYLNRKTKNGQVKVEDLKGTSKARTQFVLATLGACEEVPDPEAAGKKWLADYNPEIKREPAVTAEEVKVDMELKEPEKETAIEKKVEAEVEKENEIQN